MQKPRSMAGQCRDRLRFEKVAFAGTTPYTNNSDQAKPSRWERRAYRHNAVFVADELVHASKLDRNQRAKILWLAEVYERAEKAPGRRNGRLGAIGLTVLRALAAAVPQSELWSLLPVLYGATSLHWALSPGDLRRAGTPRARRHCSHRPPCHSREDHVCPVHR